MSAQKDERFLVILLYLHNGERSKNQLKSSSGSLEKERERQRDRETHREEKTSLVVVSRVIIIIIIIIRKRERKRERFVPCHPCLCFIVGAEIFCVFSIMKRTRKGKKKRRALAKAPLSRSAVDDDIFGKIDGCYINTGCASSLFLSDSRVLFLSFSLSKGKERNYYAGVTM